MLLFNIIYCTASEVSFRSPVWKYFSLSVSHSLCVSRYSVKQIFKTAVPCLCHSLLPWTNPFPPFPITRPSHLLPQTLISPAVCSNFTAYLGWKPVSYLSRCNLKTFFRVEHSAAKLPVTTTSNYWFPPSNAPESQCKCWTLCHACVGVSMALFSCLQTLLFSLKTCLRSPLLTLTDGQNSGLRLISVGKNVQKPHVGVCSLFLNQRNTL